MSSFAGMDEPFSRYVNANKGRQNWEEGDLNPLPRSSVAFDQQQQQQEQQQQQQPQQVQDQMTKLPRQRRETASLGIDSSNKLPKSTQPTLSSLQTSRPYAGGRYSGDRGVSVTIGQQRSPYPSSSKFFLTIIPPADLPHDPPHPRSQASTSSSSHIRRGTLLPLYPTLGGQLYAISREYGLPSIGGLSIYLCDDGEGNLGPRVGDAAWSALWNRFFDESADDLYVDITSPLPAQRSIRDQDRRFSGTSSSEMQSSPYADQSSGLRRDTDNYEDSFLNEQQRPSSSLRRTFANGYPASSMAYNTPSPRHPRIQRTVSRSSLRATPVSAQARLPIVGRIEWAVDKNRAAWWSNWIGEVDVSSERSVSSVITSQVAGGSAKRGPARRSLHLTSSLPQSQRESSVRDTILQDEVSKQKQVLSNGNASDSNRVYEAPKEAMIATEKNATSVLSSPQNSLVDLQRMGYEPIGDQDEEDFTQESKSQEHSFNSGRKIDGLPGHSQKMGSNGEASYENQSYAGYSALLGVDDETRALDELSSKTEAEEQAFQTQPLQLDNLKNGERDVQGTPRGVGVENHFNANIMMDSDEGEWKAMQGQGDGRMKAILPDHQSSRSLGEHKEMSAVHEWIAKTQSPQARQAELDLGDDDDGEEEEDLLPPQDDVEEVFELWAEKAGKVQAIASPPVNRSNRSSFASTSKIGTDRKITIQRNSGQISTTSSKQSTTASPRLKQSPSLNSLARLADLPEEMPSMLPPNPLAINKASLLSPIALDNSPATFAGPSAKLGSLLGTSRSTLGPNDEQFYPSTRQSTLDSLSMPEGDSEIYSRNNTLSSPRLELPDPQSPGAVSLGSSSTEASDTLLDMERALALLSPAVSHQNQESPAMGTSTADSTYDSGVLNSAVRVKMPVVSSKESMAKAQTLSTSVTPSPRWFRNTTPALPRIPQSISERIVSRPELLDDQIDQDLGVKASPRPTSAFVSSKHQEPLTAWKFPLPVSSIPLADQTADDKGNADQTMKNPDVDSEGEVVHEMGDSARDEVKAGSDADDMSNREASRSQMSSVIEPQDDVQMYDSPIRMKVEDEDRGHHDWLQPGELLGRQGWSETTGETSRVLTTVGDSTLPDENSTDQVEVPQKDLPLAVRSSAAISSSYSPRSNQYATIGVQAERDDASQNDSVISLVSDEAIEFDALQKMEGQENDEQEEKVEEREQVMPKSDSLQTPTFDAGSTPQMGVKAGLGHTGNSSIDFQPSIQRLIRGNSFAESSEASSTHANSPYIENEARLQGPPMRDFDWSRFGVMNADQETEGDAEDVTIQQQQHQEQQDVEVDCEPEPAAKVAGEHTSPPRGAFANDSSFDVEAEEIEDDWSQSGSEYDATSDSPATRASRLSAYSSSHHHPAGISDAGGRTPTFFYDSHLTDEVSTSGRASQRMSGYRRSSANRKSLRLSRVPVRSVDVQESLHDALGVGLLQASTATISSGPGHRDNLSVFGESIGDASYDRASMAGEAIERFEDSMPNGFEHVSPARKANQNDRSTTMTVKKNQNSNGSRAIQPPSDFSTADGTVNGSIEGPTTPQSKTRLGQDSSRRHASGPSPLNNGKAAGASLRRSMGSINEDRRIDALQGRRASASATSNNKTNATHIVPLPSPRRFKGAMLRLGSIASPNQRFRALPPSPNLLPKSIGGMGSPISSSFIANGMTHSMASPQTIFSSMDSLATTEGITSNDSIDRNPFPSPNSPLSQ